ncbi:alpha/beta hydrolase [Clostridium felsineum]|uniref:alpha/beta hydrolase n=1 Tax=Clostridium felsineum TaxID=36839 RepID=UPI00098CBFA5|nr:alpha/beta hydrolase [Clostridium felsineum]URZ17946.1 hypothetical protein CLFE_040010 [Clostridium felsineum DSM 794]
MRKKNLCLIISFVICLFIAFDIVYALPNSKMKAEDVRYVDSVFRNIQLYKDIEYSDAVNYSGQLEKLLLDVYMPSGDVEKNRPVIIWVHGGYLAEGSKDDQDSFQTIYSKEFAKKGYVTVNINYRLDPNVDKEWNLSMKNAMTDVASAIGWVKSNYFKYGMDKNNIIVAGYSAGAEVVTNLIYGTYVDGWDRSGVSGVVDMSGNRLVWGDALRNTPPCTIIHGTDDTINPFSASEELQGQLNSSDIYCELNAIEGENHFYNLKPDSTSKIENIITKFLYNKVIKNNN